MQFHTPESYVLTCLNEYPTLYSCTTLETAKLRIFDQLFNVIGNGIRDTEDLVEHLTVTSDIDVSTALKFITDEDIYYGYYKVKKIGSIEIGEGDSIDVLDSERVNYPEIKYWLKSRRIDEFDPYPNFKENYSLVHRTDFQQFGKDWADAAIWYYQNAQKFFETTPEKYHYAYPCATERDSERELNDFIERLTEYKDNEEISKAYELEYTGDPAEFLTRRWQKELTRTKEFIANTITKLENQTY